MEILARKTCNFISILDDEFNYFELKSAINNSKNTTPGKDISYKILKKLPAKALEALLELYKYIWNKGILPKQWKTTIVLPLAKPGKDITKPSSCRPIALTSTL